MKLKKKLEKIPYVNHASGMTSAKWPSVPTCLPTVLVHVGTTRQSTKGLGEVINKCILDQSHHCSQSTVMQANNNSTNGKTLNIECSGWES